MREAMIEAVFWDLGGVIVRTEDRTKRERWEQRLGMEPRQLDRFIFGGEMGHQAALGEIHAEEVWEWARQELGLSRDEGSQLTRDFWQGDDLDQELVGYIRGLRAQFQTGLISNAWLELRELLVRHWRIDDAFNDLVISAEVGLAKPGRRPGSRLQAKVKQGRREEPTEGSHDAKADSNGKQVAGPVPASVAVLPFVDMSQKQDQGYFCDGVAEEILNQLTRISNLRVASRTGSFQFRGNGADIAQIGQRLNVQTVLEGSVRKSGEQLRVTAQLINSEDGYHLWSERFDGTVSDIFTVQDQIADSIAKALRLTIDPVTKQFMHGGRTKVLKAYEFYLRAWSHFYGFSGIHLRRARQMFQRAVEIDPEFARAWAGLAATDALHCIYVGKLDELAAEAVQASRRAVELCPTLPETQTARGIALLVENDYEGAEICFQEALRFDSNHYETLYFYARACVHQGRFEDAAALYERAAQARPEDYQALLLGHAVLDSLGRTAEQRRWLEKGLRRARQHLQGYPDDARAMYLAAIAYLLLGDVETGQLHIDRAVELEPDEGIVL
ncbi:MAG: tetratricopeptide repeat protein, partial [Nitrospirae bacterium]|nr:tetratricopeptide repeat protein [Nitrospirota bacterium]